LLLHFGLYFQYSDLKSLSLFGPTRRERANQIELDS